MKSTILLFGVIAIVHFALAQQSIDYFGAPVELKLTVRDDRGNPVKGARVRANFWSPYCESSEQSKLTDEKGEVDFSGKGYVDTRYIVNKDGYYKSEGHANLVRPRDPATTCSAFLRWEPVIRDVTLKKVRHPISGFLHHNIPLTPPCLNQPIGLDLEHWDWLPPYGMGKHEDVKITFEAQHVVQPNFSKDLVTAIHFTFPNPNDGMQICSADTFSTFAPAYHVDVKKPFMNTVSLARQPPTEYYQFLSHTSYLAFRVRSRKDDSGAIVAHYGFIYQLLDISGQEFRPTIVFFNPTPNDTNIEYDPKRSLAKSYADRRWEATQKRLAEERKMLEEMGVENFIRAVRAKRSGASGTPKQEAKGAAE